MARQAALFVASVALAMCKRESGAFDARLAYGSGRDVDRILQANGVKAAAVHCTNPRLGGSVVRGVSCTVRLTAHDVDTLVVRVPLAPSAPLFGGHADSCETIPGLAQKDAGVEILRGKNTKVTNGVSDVSIHVVRATGTACVDIKYPWG